MSLTRANGRPRLGCQDEGGNGRRCSEFDYCILICEKDQIAGLLFMTAVGQMKVDGAVTLIRWLVTPQGECRRGEWKWKWMWDGTRPLRGKGKSHDLTVVTPKQCAQHSQGVGLGIPNGSDCRPGPDRGETMKVFSFLERHGRMWSRLRRRGTRPIAETAAPLQPPPHIRDPMKQLEAKAPDDGCQALYSTVYDW